MNGVNSRRLHLIARKYTLQRASCEMSRDDEIRLRNNAEAGDADIADRFAIVADHPPADAHAFST